MTRSSPTPAPADLVGISKEQFFELIRYEPHPKQWLYHRSDARFRVPACGRRFGKSKMSGRDEEYEMLKPDRMTWIVGPCVDEQTEILTARGWLRFDQVQGGDETLSVNPVTGLSEWDTVEKVLRHPGEHEMIHIESHSFSTLATPDHRWLTHRRPGIGYKKSGSKLPAALMPIKNLLPPTDNGWTWRTTETLTADDRIPKAAPCSQTPIEQKYTDEFVELVAWLWTEGSQDKKGGLYIHQSHIVNEPNVARIRRALVALCPNPHRNHSRSKVQQPYWSELVSPSNPDQTNFYIGKILAEGFKEVFLNHKVVAPSFVRELTSSQLQMFVDISVMGDGTVGPSGQTVIYQDNEQQLFAVQLACSLLGIATSLRPRGSSPGWILGLLTSTFVNPKRAQYVAGEEGVKITRERYSGTTWCVTTRNGNWLAKRRGTVYYTANTYDLGEKEFRVMWDDFIIGLGLGRSKSVRKAYNKRQGDMYIELPWGSRVEVRSADNPSNLVGESLDKVIMSEAAKHNRETWDRYIRPALTDRQGRADFPSTPEGWNWFHDIFGYGRDTDPRFKDYEAWQFPSWDNPYVFPLGANDPEVELLKLTMSQEEFAQEIAALFTSFAGKIFGDWSEEVHVTHVPFDPSLPNYGCADEATEIFTSQGWKRHSDLAVGDTVLTLNESTGLSEWDTVLRVNRYEGEHLVTHMEGRSHSSVTTQDHRWLANRAYARKSGGTLGWRWTTTDKLTQDDRIPTAVPCSSLPTEPKYTDSFVELVAWLWTEGSFNNNALSIHQSHKANPQNVARIRAALTALEPSPVRGIVGYWSESIRPSQPDITTFGLSRNLSDVFFMSALSQHKIVRPEFICSLTYSQLRLFIDVSILGDGHRRGNNTAMVGQKRQEQLEALQMACCLVGINTTLKPQRTPRGDYYYLYINSSMFVNPGMAARHKDGKFLKETKPLNGLVWCPTTGNGTWLARRNGTVYYTGNCFDWGWTDPLCFIEFQVGPNDQIRIWREHYKSHMTLPDHLQYLKGREERGENPPGYRLDLCFGDAEDPSAIMQVCTGFAPCISDNEARQPWRRGIDLMASFLKLRQIGEADEFGTPLEEPGLVCDFSCANFRREMNNYKRKPGAVGNDMRGSVVTTGDDHAIDPIRYGLVHLFVLGANAHLTDLYSVESLRASGGSGMVASSNGQGAADGLWLPADRGIFTMTDLNF